MMPCLIVEIRAGKQRVSNLPLSLMHDHTPHRPHNATSPQCHQPPFWCQLQQKKKTSLHHHGSRSHDDVDTDTESKCDSRCASLENQVLCVAVITKAEGHKNSQNYTFFCNKRRRCTSGMSPLPGRKTANLERVRRIPSHTWRPRSIAKSTLNTEIQEKISADMLCQKQTSRLRYARSNLDMWSTCARKKKIT